MPYFGCDQLQSDFFSKWPWLGFVYILYIFSLFICPTGEKFGCLSQTEVLFKKCIYSLRFYLFLFSLWTKGALSLMSRFNYFFFPREKSFSKTLSPTWWKSSSGSQRSTSSSVRSLTDQRMPESAHSRAPESYWYKPNISREDAVKILRDGQAGDFIVRDSNSYQQCYGLAVRVERHQVCISIKNLQK